MGRAEMRVADGHFDIGVAQDVLDLGQRGPALDQVRGAGMAQRVEHDPFELRRPDGIVKGAPHVAPLPAILPGKDEPVELLPGERVQGSIGCGVHDGFARFPALRFAQVNDGA